ncbi:MAG: hypothetical protein ABW321_12125, partial [Polyangiales bacterium]
GRSPNARRSGRARPGVPFDNGLIAFQVVDGTYDRLTTLRLTSSTTTPKLYLDGSNVGPTTPLFGVMPVDMRYSYTDQTLYIVDITARGLLPLSFDTMPTSLSSASTIR